MEDRTSVMLDGDFDIRTPESIEEVIAKFHTDQPLMKLQFIRDSKELGFCYIAKSKVIMIGELK